MKKEDYLANGWVPLYGYEDKILVKSGCNYYINLNYKNTGEIKELTPIKTKNGHLNIHFSVNKQIYTNGLHCAIYETYNKMRIEKGYEIHHIDFNPFNNTLENLVMLTKGEHSRLHRLNKPTYTDCIKKTSKPVLQYTKENEFVAEYPSASEAARQTSINSGQIIGCCRNKYGYKTAGGYVWKYKN